MKYHKYLIILILLLLTSCAVEDNKERPGPPNEATHTLDTLFTITEPADEITISQVTDIRFLSNGHFIIDYHRNSRRLLEFSATGELEEQIGTTGRGSGEFASINRFLITPDDTLHIFDGENTRQQVFARTDDGWEPVRTIDAERNLSDEFIASYPLRAYPAKGPGYRTLFSNDFFYSDTTHRHYRFFSRTGYGLDYTGERRLLRPVQDAVLTRNGREFSAHWSARYPAAFYRYRPASGEVVYINNTSSEIRLLGWQGDERVAGRLPYERVPLNREQVELRLDQLSDSYSDERMARIRSKYMEHEPFYREVFLDSDTLWVRVSRSDPSTPDWMVTSLGGEVRAAFHSPASFEALAVRRGKLYGVLTPEEEVRLAVYELRILNDSPR